MSSCQPISGTLARCGYARTRERAGYGCVLPKYDVSPDDTASAPFGRLGPIRLLGTRVYTSNLPERNAITPPSLGGTGESLSLSIAVAWEGIGIGIGIPIGRLHAAIGPGGRSFDVTQAPRGPCYSGFARWFLPSMRLVVRSGTLVGSTACKYHAWGLPSYVLMDAAQLDSLPCSYLACVTPTPRLSSRSLSLLLRSFSL